MTAVRPISLAKVDQSPKILSGNKILYFDDFSDEELRKYREFLNSYHINKVNEINEKVLFVTGLINNLHRKHYYQGDVAVSEYPEYVIIKGSNAYCQSSSLLLTLMLSSISVYSRHWHASYQDNRGYHQFIEYYNPQRHKWIIVDPFYGVQYEKNGELLSTGEVGKLILEGADAKGLIKVLGIKSYYDPHSIEGVWANKLILARANDYIKYELPETKYGIFGKLSFFDRLPAKVKKFFRIFGRNNSMHEVFNFRHPRENKL